MDDMIFLLKAVNRIHGKMKYNAIFRLFGTDETYWVGLKGTGVPVSAKTTLFRGAID